MNCDYECPRCGYKTKRRSNMYNHLYKKIKPCVGIKSDLILNKTIKDAILQNKVYDDNTIEKAIQIQSKSFEQEIQEEYSNLITKYDENLGSLPLWRYGLDKNDLINIINNHTRKKNNIVYDRNKNDLWIYNDEWKSYPLEIGVIQILKYIQSNFLDYYEEYLLDKRHADQYPREQQKARELLEDYYLNFVIPFDLMPYLMNYENNKMKEYADRYYYIYASSKNRIKITYIIDLKNMVIRMIKNNCSIN